MTWKSSDAIALAQTAVAVLCALEDEGFDVDVVASQLRVRPARRLTDAHREAIRQHRDDLIELVQSCDPGVVSRRALFRRQWLLDDTTTFLVCPDLGWERGQCFSCSDALEEPRYGRCWRCHVAWRLAAGRGRQVATRLTPRSSAGSLRSGDVDSHRKANVQRRCTFEASVTP